jgi:hypothetical protein
MVGGRPFVVGRMNPNLTTVETDQRTLACLRSIRSVPSISLGNITFLRNSNLKIANSDSFVKQEFENGHTCFKVTIANLHIQGR